MTIPNLIMGSISSRESNLPRLSTSIHTDKSDKSIGYFIKDTYIIINDMVQSIKVKWKGFDSDLNACLSYRVGPVLLLTDSHISQVPGQYWHWRLSQGKTVLLYSFSSYFIGKYHCFEQNWVQRILSALFSLHLSKNCSIKCPFWENFHWTLDPLRGQ